MRPVLALELSVDGILLHELSYDGKWRQIAAAALNDPFLPKKMSAMKATARASQGRFFKNEVWVPREQMFTFEYSPESDDDDDRMREALSSLDKNPAIPAGDYIARLSDEDAKGSVKVVAMEKSVLAEAKRFATGYGFNADGVTFSGKISGFYNQPYFDQVQSRAPSVSVDYRKIGFFAGLTGLAAGLAFGGYWLYNSIEFSPDPATVLEASENRVFSDEEDPRAPIRPTFLSVVASQGTPATVETGAAQLTIPALDLRLDEVAAHVGSTDMASDLNLEAQPERGQPLAAISFWQEAPERAAESRPDSLPAPESVGFPVVAEFLTAPNIITASANVAMGSAISTYISKYPVNDFDVVPQETDLPISTDSTVLLAAQSRKFDESLGLTQVLENNAAEVRLALAADFQNLPATVVSGRPDILPILRSGADVTEIIAPVVVEVAVAVEPVIPQLSISELQNLAPIVIEGALDVTPVLRGGVEIGAAPPIIVAAAEPARELTLSELQNLEAVVIEGQPDVAPILRPEALVTDEVVEAPEVAEIVETPPAPELSIEELQNLAAVVIEGTPDTVPALRGGIEIGAEPVALPAPIAPTRELTLDELQNLAAVVIEGSPSTQPLLRGGIEIGAAPVVPEEPAVPAPELSLEELQNLAAVVVEGAPSTIPTLRGGIEIGAEPVVPPTPPEPLDPEAEAELIATLQSAPAEVLEGRPEVSPTLRDGTDLGEGSGIIAEEPETVSAAIDPEAARLRPLFRPISIADIAKLNDPDLSAVIVPRTQSPPRRAADFGDRVTAMMESFAETERTTPRFTEEPREVSLPTSANVAREATIENGINLRETSLIGVYGKPGAYRALIRQRGGIYSMVTIGQSVGGWTIVGIDESTVRIQRGNRSEILRLPG